MLPRVSTSWAIAHPLITEKQRDGHKYQSEEKSGNIVSALQIAEIGQDFALDFGG